VTSSCRTLNFTGGFLKPLETLPPYAPENASNNVVAYTVKNKE